MTAGREPTAPDDCSSAGAADMAPALPHREYASRASFGRRLASDLFEQPASFSASGWDAALMRPVSEGVERGCTALPRSRPGRAAAEVSDGFARSDRRSVRAGEAGTRSW